MICARMAITVATAESCTGGLIAAALTDIAGSSDVVDRGFVTYSNNAKTELLGVPEPLIAAHGAVSEAVARAMAEGALDRSLAGVAVAVTGRRRTGRRQRRRSRSARSGSAARSAAAPPIPSANIFPGDRAAIRAATVLRAFELFRRALPA